ncbi:MAG: thioredoxin [Epulopiscium sp.]|nr:thioredoxin [Candidatus Epulonipiscium sp.]
MVFEFTDKNFKEEALGSDIPVMVDFYADWCGPCKMLAPIIDELAEEYDGKVKIGKLDTDANRKMATEFNIMSIPTIAFIKDGKVVDTSVGVLPKTALQEKLNALL